MSFKDIYKKVEEFQGLGIHDILDQLDIDVIHRECLPLDKMSMYVDKCILINNSLSEQMERNALLHEIGHALFDKGCYLANHRTEENNANWFMCLFLIFEGFWEYDYFDEFLIYEGVPPKIARQFNDGVWQYKRQVKLELAY